MKFSRFVYWTYIVQCKYGTFYAGYTNDLKKRIKFHDEGKGAKYLRGKGPVKLVYKKKFKTVQEAMFHERWIKGLTRKNKEMLIRRGVIYHARLSAGSKNRKTNE